MRIVVDKTTPLDPYQAQDMKIALLDVRTKVCRTDAGERIAIRGSTAAHTLTDAIVFCDPSVEALEVLIVQLVAALNVIYAGQTLYGPAAVEANLLSHNSPTVSGGDPKQIGRLGAYFQLIPPAAPHNWDKDSIGLTVHDNPGFRIIVFTNHRSGPTLDKWETEWFRVLCMTAMKWIQDWGTRQDPAEEFWWSLPPEYEHEITIRFEPFRVPGTDLPTDSVLVGVMKTLILLFDDRGARQLQFNLVNNNGGHVGVGYLEYGQVPSQLVVTNATIEGSTD